MINLGLTANPVSIDLPGGARITCHAPTTSNVQGVRDALLAEVEPDADGKVRLPMVAYVKAVARGAIFDWDGVGDAKGKPAPVIGENIDALMEVSAVYDVFLDKYMRRAELVADEGNG